MDTTSLNLDVQELEVLDAPGFWSGLIGVAVGVGLGLGALAIT